MSNAEQLLSQLRSRKTEPMMLRLMLADIAKVYGEGFADALRRQIEREIADERGR